MPSGNSGINKPFDRILKSFADEAPALFLRLLGVIPEGVEAAIQPLRPETAPSVVLPDYAAVVRVGLAIPIIFHAEFQASYYRDAPRDIARYGGSLAWQYQLPVVSVLVMLRAKGVPAVIPKLGVYSIGKTHTTHPFRVVRLWEVDPTPVLATKDPKLLPWAVLMRSTDQQVREIASVLARQEDEEAVGRFLTLGGIRYDRNALDQMLGGKMGLIKAILDASLIVQEVREEGVAEGTAKGKAEGKAEEARKFLRLLLSKNFPELESLPEIDTISNADALESLIRTSFDAESADQVRVAILAAAKPN